MHDRVTEPDPKRWQALAVLSIAYLMVVLDIAIVNVALPSIQKDLNFSSTENLQWIVSGYALTFGGFLLLGGRMGDVLGRRRVFMIGLALFSATSLLAGLSTSSAMLIGARVAQGAAGAILSPSVFSITSVTFEEGAERNKALGVLGAISGAGAAIGVILGGVLTDLRSAGSGSSSSTSRSACCTLFFVPRLVRESRAEGMARQFDSIGAVLVTGGLMLFVYALTRTNQVGWSSARDDPGVHRLGAADRRIHPAGSSARPHALVPLRIFQASHADRREHRRPHARDDGLRDVLPAVAVHAAGPRLHALSRPASATSPSPSRPSSRPARHRRWSPRPASNRRCSAVWRSSEPASSSSRRSRRPARTSTDLFPGFIILGIGLGFTFVPISIAALAGVTGRDAGLASGLINTSQQIGGALGLAILTTVATSHISKLAPNGHPTPADLTSGYALAFWVAAGVAAAAIVTTLLIVRKEDLELAAAESAAGAVG